MKDIMDEIATSSFIKKRENVFSVDVKEEDWWSGSSGYTKWSLFGALLVIILAWLIGGHLHAKRRLRKGRPLMAYHRFLVSRRERRQYNMQHPDLPNAYHGWFSQPPANGYAMQPVHEQLPAYNAEVPPIYQPPQGNSKENGYIPSPPPPPPPPPPNDVTTPTTNYIAMPPSTTEPSTQQPTAIAAAAATDSALPVIPVVPDPVAVAPQSHTRT